MAAGWAWLLASGEREADRAFLFQVGNHFNWGVVREEAPPHRGLGRLEVTEGVVDLIPAEEGELALERHQSGDWGDCGYADWKRNNDALRDGGDLRSIYHTAEGIEFWILTRADRTSTRVLLPSEY